MKKLLLVGAFLTAIALNAVDQMYMTAPKTRIGVAKLNNDNQIKQEDAFYPDFNPEM